MLKFTASAKICDFLYCVIFQNFKNIHDSTVEGCL